MCGIVGILGREPVAGSLVDALKRLEYRGYDSAGVATLESGQLARRRAEGKLRNLEARLAREPLTGTIGIGHTRWATHGRPTESNAHPHATDRLAVVHNGIIENFRELREELEKNGRDVRLRDRHRGGRPSRDAGDEERPLAGRGGGGGAAAAARRLRARLPVRGRGRSPDRRAQGLAARDRLRRRRNVSRLRRHRARSLHRRDLAISRTATGPCSRARASRSTTPRAARSNAPCSDRRPRPSWSTRATIATSWRRRSTSSRRSSATRSRTISTWRPSACGCRPTCRSTFARSSASSISACGTAYYAGLVGKYWFERFARLPVEIDVASEFRYREAPLSAGGLAIFVSQSGETADTLATLRYAKEHKQHVARGRQRPDLDDRARKRRGDADARRPRDRRRLDQGLHLPARGARLPCDRRPAAPAACCPRRTSESWCAR